MTRKTKGTGGLSTAIDVLEEMADKHPIVRRVVEYRQTSKLKSTYADALPALIDPATGRVHTSYNQTVAATGRLSSSDPNLQNIPARGEMGPRFRRAFIPAEGLSPLAADYSQIELRVLAHMSGDAALVETFRRGADVHQETADRVFGDPAGLFRDEARRRAKIINFSVVYGTSAFSLAKQLETSAAEAQRFIDAYEASYPGVKAFLDGEVERARATGSSVTLFGRKRPVPELRAADRALARVRPPHRPQHAHPGHRRRPDEEGHDRRAARHRAAGAALADDPPGARRARLRGAAPTSGRGHGQARPRGHGKRHGRRLRAPRPAESDARLGRPGRIANGSGSWRAFNVPLNPSEKSPVAILRFAAWPAQWSS